MWWAVRRRKTLIGSIAGAAVLATSATEAFAHVSERAHVLLLPTRYYAYGGALAVLLSFLVLAFLSPRPLQDLAARRLPVAVLPVRGRAVASLASCAILFCLVVAGMYGSRDPLSNPLPLVIWTLGWVGLTLAHGLLGNLWSWLNPWYGPWRVAAKLSGEAQPPLHLPQRAGQWPAVALLLAFAWFELVYPAPDDPERLAAVVLAYWLLTFAGILLFGYRDWMQRVEFLSVFFGMVARFSIFEATRADDGRSRLSLCLPGAKLGKAEALTVSGTAFLLLALGSVSFDGLMRTFFWLDLTGVNPLEFPGRSAVVAPNSLGLVLMFAVLASAFLLAVRLGGLLTGDAAAASRAAGLLVWSIVPISLAYHFSHYLVVLLVNGQYALSALSDPLAKGWNLFGTAAFHVQAGVALGARSAWLIWNAQAAAIIGGHVLAVIIAHLLAFRIFGSGRTAVISQIPLAVLMVAYTVFGLWLLSTPTGG